MGAIHSTGTKQTYDIYEEYFKEKRESRDFWTESKRCLALIDKRTEVAMRALRTGRDWETDLEYRALDYEIKLSQAYSDKHNQVTSERRKGVKSEMPHPSQVQIDALKWQLEEMKRTFRPKRKIKVKVIRCDKCNEKLVKAEKPVGRCHKCVQVR